MGQPSEQYMMGIPTEPKVASAVEPASDMSGPDVANYFGVTPRALRFYESRGLISPRREGRARIYSAADRSRIALILKAKKLGFTLTEIAPMLDARSSGGSSAGLRLTAAKCLKQIQHLESQMQVISEALAELKQIHLDLTRKGSQGATK